jgi:hypothetical protein
VDKCTALRFSEKGIYYRSMNKKMPAHWICYGAALIIGLILAFAAQKSHAQTSHLTPIQVDAIVQLLASFEVPQDTVEQVRVLLTEKPQAQVSRQIVIPKAEPVVEDNDLGGCVYTRTKIDYSISC